MKVFLKYCELLLGPELVLEAEDTIFRNLFCAHIKCDTAQLNKNVSSCIENVTEWSEILLCNHLCKNFSCSFVIELCIAFLNVSLL